MEHIYIIFILTILLLISIFILINKITIKINNIENASSTLDIMLKKRYDLIPNLVKIIKAYTKYEKDTLERLVLLREEGIKSKDKETSDRINKDIKNELKSIYAQVENYPDLKSNINYIQLQTILEEIEDQISAARRTYNAHVTDYNIFISIIPVNILAFILGYKKYQLFKAKKEEKELKKWMNDNE